MIFTAKELGSKHTRYINFKTLDDCGSFSLREMELLCKIEQEGCTVCMVHNDFDHDSFLHIGEAVPKEQLKGNRLILIAPIRDKDRYSFHNPNIYGENNFKSYVVDDCLASLDDELELVPRPLSQHKTLEEAVAEANACYGAKTEEEFRQRLLDFRKSLETKSEGKNK